MPQLLPRMLAKRLGRAVPPVCLSRGFRALFSVPSSGKSLDPGPGDGAAKHGRDATRQVDGILGLDRKGSRVALAVFAIVKHARPFVGGRLLGALHDEK